MNVTIENARRMGKPPFGATLAVPIGPDDRLRTIGPIAALGLHAPHDWPAQALPPDADFRPHPHIGLAAITYVLHGHMTHRDSLGSRQEVGAGGLNCLIAGRGVVHSERFERTRVLGGTQSHMQILVALPDGREDLYPSFTHVAADRVPQTTHDGVTTRALVDSTPGATSALDLPMSVFVHDVQLALGARYPVPMGFDARAIYVLSGAIELAGQRVEAHQTAVLGEGAASAIALEDARVIAFGGERVGPRYMWWNFLHSSLERLDEAKAAWRQGKMTLPPGDTESFAPAPPDDGRPLRRFNAD